MVQTRAARDIAEYLLVKCYWKRFWYRRSVGTCVFLTLWIRLCSPTPCVTCPDYWYSFEMRTVKRQASHWYLDEETVQSRTSCLKPSRGLVVDRLGGMKQGSYKASPVWEGILQQSFSKSLGTKILSKSHYKGPVATVGGTLALYGRFLDCLHCGRVPYSAATSALQAPALR